MDANLFWNLQQKGIVEYATYSITDQ